MILSCDSNNFVIESLLSCVPILTALRPNPYCPASQSLLPCVPILTARRPNHYCPASRSLLSYVSILTALRPNPYCPPSQSLLPCVPIPTVPSPAITQDTSGSGRQASGRSPSVLWYPRRLRQDNQEGWLERTLQRFWHLLHLHLCLQRTLLWTL